MVNVILSPIESNSVSLSSAVTIVAQPRICTIRIHATALVTPRKARTGAVIMIAAFSIACFGPLALAQSGTIITPDDLHSIPWANPTANEAIRVLIIAPRFTLSDATEFARHVECELTVAPIWSRTEIGGPIHHPSAIPESNEREALAMLRDRLSKKYDLIVAANFDFRILPDSIIETLADKVGDGTGLILANIDPTLDQRWADGMTPLNDAEAFRSITRGIGDRHTPAWADGLEFLYLATLGAGNIAWLDYPGGAPATQCLQPLSADIGLDSDFSVNYFSLIVRCAHWAAGIQPTMTITSIDAVEVATADEEQVPAGLVREDVEEMQAAMHASAAKRFDVRLSGPADRDYSVRTRTRRPGDHGGALAVLTGTHHVQKGDELFPVYVAAGTGNYYLDVWLLDGDDVVDWFTHHVEVKQWPRIEQIEFDRSWIGRSADLAINGIVELNPYRATSTVARARAFDAVGRLLAQTESEVVHGTNRVRLVLALEDVAGPLVRIEIAALDRTAIEPAPWEYDVAATYRESLPVFDDAQIRSYQLLANWSVADQSVSRSAFVALRDLGLDGVYLPAGGTAVHDAAASGLRPMVGARMVRDVDQSGAEQESLFFNPRIEPLLDVVRDGAPMGATPFLLQRSIAPSADGVGNPNFVRSYQNAVQRDYHNINTVNAVWRTNFIDWSDLTQPTRRDSMRTKNFEPWMRYQAATDETRSANWDIMASLMRQAFEGARVGFDFTDPFPHESIDWRSTSAILAPPDPLTVERTRSYLAPDADGFMVFPDLLLEDGSAFGSWLPWYGLFHGFSHGVWPEAVGQADRVPSTLLLDANGDPRAVPPPALREVQKIKSGIGTLLLEADRNACGIAIYDSRTSEHLNLIERSFTTDSAQAQRALVALLEALDYQFDFVAPSAALDGALEEYDVLILPMARALSDDEVRTVFDFHENGGCVVADIAPGQFDENGIPRDVLPLDDLFGVQHPRPVQAAGPSGTLVELRLEDGRVTAALPAVYTDASVEPIDGHVGGMADHVPTWIVHDSDRGKAVLLNHAIPPYRDPSGETERGMRVLMGALLARWAPALPVDVQTRNGFFGETVHWRYGDAQVVTLLAHPLQKREAAKVRVNFPKSSRVYDRLVEGSRSKKGALDLEIGPGQPAVLVGLPYEVRGMELETAKSVVPGERLPFKVTLNTGKIKPGRHLIRVELVPPLNSPFGSRINYLEANGGVASGRLRLALNDRGGIYLLRAQDLLTGVVTERAIQVGVSTAANEPFGIRR